MVPRTSLDSLGKRGMSSSCWECFLSCPVVSALNVSTELCWHQIKRIMRIDTYMVHPCYKT
jgi:hypothetical protein